MIYCIFQKNNTVLAASCVMQGRFIGLWSEEYLLNNVLFNNPNSPVLNWNTSLISTPAQLFVDANQNVINENPPITNKNTISHIFSQSENDALVAFFDTPEFLSYWGCNDYASFAVNVPATAKAADLIKMVATDPQAIWYIIESADKPVVAEDALYALLFYYIFANPFAVQINWRSNYSSRAILQDHVQNTTINTAGIFNLTDTDIANIVNSTWLADTIDINGFAFIPLPTALQSLFLDVWYNRKPNLTLAAPVQLETINSMIPVSDWYCYLPEPFTTHYNYLRKLLKRT